MRAALIFCVGWHSVRSGPYFRFRSSGGFPAVPVSERKQRKTTCIVRVAGGAGRCWVRRLCPLLWLFGLHRPFRTCVVSSDGTAGGGLDRYCVNPVLSFPLGKYIRLYPIIICIPDFQHISARTHPPKPQSGLGAGPFREIVARFWVMSYILTFRYFR